MNAATLNETVVLGALTGMRSMAGPAILALRQQPGLLRTIVPVMAAGEMIADKTSLIGDRIDPVPLAGRALMGAVVGGVVAREHRGSALVHGIIGASAAVIAAHLAFRARKRLPLSGLWGGLLEDAVVLAVAAFYASPSRRAGG